MCQVLCGCVEQCRPQYWERSTSLGADALFDTSYHGPHLLYQHILAALVMSCVIFVAQAQFTTNHLSRPDHLLHCQLCPMATVDLLSKGDTQKGWEKVTGTSVMDVLKWRTGEYRCLVSDAEPLPVPGLMFVSDNISFFHLAHAASKTRILFLWMPNVETHMSVDSPQYHCRVQFVSELLSSGWTMEYYHHYAWPEQICTSVWHS